MILKGKNKKKSKNIIDSFHYAFEGIFYALKNVRNLKIHLVFTFLVLIFSFILKISKLELLVCLLFIALVISLELINTAVEEAVDLAMPNIHPVAKVAKDVSAGAVLFSALISVVGGIIIFLPKIINLWS